MGDGVEVGMKCSGTEGGQDWVGKSCGGRGSKVAPLDLEPPYRAF